MILLNILLDDVSQTGGDRMCYYADQMCLTVPAIIGLL
jgi:hypothetical protein